MAQPNNIGISFIFSVLYGDNQGSTGALIVNPASNDRLEVRTQGWFEATQFLPLVIGPGRCAFYHAQTQKYLSVSSSNHQIEANKASLDDTCMFVVEMPPRSYNQFPIRAFGGKPLRIAADGAKSIVLADGKGQSPFYIVPAFLGVV